MIKRLIIFYLRFAIILGLIMYITLAFSADHCILDGGSGDGSAWDNAWDALPATLVRGDTYYIGDGNYAAYIFDDAVDANTYIYIKKATASAHGTETGWNASYGDGQAVFVPELAFNTSYWSFDGITGSGFTQSSYGFMIDGNAFDEDDLVTMTTGGGVSYVTISHTYFLHKDSDSLPEGTVDWTSIRTNPSSGTNDYITISNNCFYGSTAVIQMRRNNYPLIERNYFEENAQNTNNHGAAIVGYRIIGTLIPNIEATVRYNFFKNMSGTAVITHEGQDWQIYGNVFWFTPTMIGSTGQGLVRGGRQYTPNCKFYHNTIVDRLRPDGTACTNGFEVYEDANSWGYGYNNLYYNVNYVRNIEPAEPDPNDEYGVCYHDLDPNLSESGAFENRMWHFVGTWNNKDETVTTASFTDYANDIFSLVHEVAAPTDLSGDPNYNMVDMNGITRGVDGIVTIGAYEYDSNVSVYTPGSGGPGGMML